MFKVVPPEIQTPLPEARLDLAAAVDVTLVFHG